MSEWQPIETAPKSGMDILLLYGSVHEGRWHVASSAPDVQRKQKIFEHGWYWAGFNGPVGPIFPTHWMPLPEPPHA
jgi:hypothetical protein